MKEFYTIGEIAKIYDVSTDTLRYYDKINLLKPWHTGENGYRYYSKAQFETISTIMVLRAMGTPIENLKSAINSPTPRGITEALDIYVHSVDEEISRLQNLKGEAILLKKEIADVVSLYEARLEEVPAMWMFSKAFGDEDELDIDSILKVNRLANKSWTTHAKIVSTIKKEELLKMHFHTYDRYGYLSEASIGVESNYLSVIPKRRCVVCNAKVHSLEHIEMDGAYIKCLKFIREHDLSIVGDAIESNILSLCADDPFNPEMYFKVYIPIE